MPFFPQSASTISHNVDLLLFYLLGVAAFFVVLIFVLIIVFSIKYRARPGASACPPAESHSSLALEIAWIAIPLVLLSVMFFWGASIYFLQTRVPADAMQVYVIGKQWMWKFQHPSGRREINELHIPVDQNVRLIMATEDVIHSLFVPAFRLKQDVVPGRYTSLWFKANKVGEYQLFCSQYCGTDHAKMHGKVIVMQPQDFQAWLAGDTGGTPAQAGEKLFQKLACITCHSTGSGARGPDLTGLFGSSVRLAGGKKVIADEVYFRESVMDPTAKVVEGYQPIMPTFKGLVSEEQLLQLMEYVKSLKGKTADETAHADPQTTSTGR